MLRLLFVAILLLLSLPGFAHPSSDTKLPPVRVAFRPFAPPDSFLITEGGKTRMAGLGPELMERLLEVIGREMVPFKSSGIQTKREWLREGVVDVIGLNSWHPRFMAGFRFLPLPLSLDRQLFVRANWQGATRPEELDREPVVVLGGDDYAPYLTHHTGELIEVETPEQALDLLNQGMADAYLAPSGNTALSVIERSRMYSVTPTGPVLGQIPLGMVFRHGDTELYEQFRKALIVLQQKGELELLRRKWRSRATPLERTWARYGSLILMGEPFWEGALCRGLLEPVAAAPSPSGHGGAS